MFIVQFRTVAVAPKRNDSDAFVGSSGGADQGAEYEQG